MQQNTGKTQTVSDRMDPARAQALHAVLQRSGEAPKAGDILPLFWHHIYFWQALSPLDIGRDGHAKPGDFIPDTGLPRRMWAGGTVTFHMPLCCAKAAQKCTTIAAVERKVGRSGPLAFVTLRHDISQHGTLCVSERQDLVYRTEPEAGGGVPSRPAPTARIDETLCQTRRFDVPTLFRYSALTLNGHRIHYDRTYCRETEGYPGLVVHAPLLVQYLIILAEQTLGAIAQISFRATAPLFDFEEAEFCINGHDLWVRGPDGRQVMQASVTQD